MPWNSLKLEAKQVKYLVTKNHNPEIREILLASVGNILQFERSNTIYSGWIWCTNIKGIQAWVPEAFVAIEGNTCHMIRDYISRELHIEVGEEVEVIEIESGWALANDGKNECGWIPMECLERVEPQEFSD